MLAIRENPNASIQGKTDNLREILEQQTKENLVELIYSMTERDNAFKQSLILRFAKPEDELALCKKLIKEHIRQHKKRGFIEWNELYPALTGAWDVAKRAEGYVKTDCMRAIHLCLLVLHEVAPMYQYSDDSGGELNDITQSVVDIIAEAVLEGQNALSKDSRDELFNLIFKEIDNKLYEDWLSFWLDFIKILTPLCGDPALYQRLWDKLTEKSNRQERYFTEKILWVQFQLLEQWGSKAESQTFLLEHLQYHAFRRYAIFTAMERAEYNAALQYAQDGLKQSIKDKDSRIGNEWREALIAIYDALGDTEKILELAEYFVRNVHYGIKYYPLLKKLTQPDRWQDKLQELIAFFEPAEYTSETYVQILVAENDLAHLLAVCHKNHQRIVEFAPLFPDKYRQEVEKLYIIFIFGEAKTATTRPTYKTVCRYLKEFSKIFGKDAMRKLALQLAAEYKNRPAFLDELGKLVK
jgi:hypothetical protein